MGQGRQWEQKQKIKSLQRAVPAPISHLVKIEYTKSEIKLTLVGEIA
jgi:hypothetical protein